MSESLNPCSSSYCYWVILKTEDLPPEKVPPIKCFLEGSSGVSLPLLHLGFPRPFSSLPSSSLLGFFLYHFTCPPLPQTHCSCCWSPDLWGFFFFFSSTPHMLLFNGFSAHRSTTTSDPNSVPLAHNRHTLLPCCDINSIVNQLLENMTFGHSTACLLAVPLSRSTCPFLLSTMRIWGMKVWKALLDSPE